MITPLNKNNSAYTTLPQELLSIIKTDFESTFSSQTKKGDFYATGRVYRSEIILRVSYLRHGSIRQINFDSSKEIIENTSPVSDLNELLHANKELFLSYFKQENTENFSPSWAPYQGFNNKKTPIFYKYDGTNTSLEEAASKLLGETHPETSLVVGDTDESEAIEKIIDSLQTSNFSKH